MILDIEATKNKYGCDPTKLTFAVSRKMKIVVTCELCKNSSEITVGGFRNKKGGICKKCPEHSKNRSEIATRSNKNRTKDSEKHKKYLPYLQDLADGKTSFLEIAEKLGLDDSTVCKFFKKNFGIKSKFGNKSLQEDKVFLHLRAIFGKVERSVRYSSENRYISDFYVDGVGFIEYDGGGFYHQLKENDKTKDDLYRPLRLNAQAVFGGIDYLRFILKNEKTGYCSVTTPKKYEVKKLDKISPANDMLDNCHVLKSAQGRDVFGLFYANHLIGVAKFGIPTNKNDSGIELRRFFVLDGTPKNTESWFLDKCQKMITGHKKLITYTHAHERGSYLKALGWKEHEHKEKDYDFYIIDGKTYSKRTVWGWAKKTGLVDKMGTTSSKEFLVSVLGGKKIIEPSKKKFTLELK